MPLAHYFIHDEHYGSTNIDETNCRSRAYFCEACGNIWARFVVDDAECWNLTVVPCEEHSGHTSMAWFKVGGSVTDVLTMSADLAPTWNRVSTLRYLPKRVLEREYLILLAKWIEWGGDLHYGRKVKEFNP